MKKQLHAARHTLAIEGDVVPIIIRKHPTSRRIIIRYQPLKHSISVTLPRYATLKQGLRFVEEKRAWIARERARHGQKLGFCEGAILPVLGKPYRLQHIGGRGVVRIEGDAILVPGEAAFMARRVRDWLVAIAKKEITALSIARAEMIGKSVRRISLRDTHSHWGSCNSGGNLSFSWRLVLAPYEVLEYVVCHEVAHLAEMNHSRAFWSVVRQLCPQFEACRVWIKTHGARLYQYG